MFFLNLAHRLKWNILVKVGHGVIFFLPRRQDCEKPGICTQAASAATPATVTSCDAGRVARYRMAMAWPMKPIAIARHQALRLPTRDVRKAPFLHKS